MLRGAVPTTRQSLASPNGVPESGRYGRKMAPRRAEVQFTCYNAAKRGCLMRQLASRPA